MEGHWAKDVFGGAIGAIHLDTNVKSYLIYDNCHNTSWIKNISKGKFKRVKWNCTKKEDFLEQLERNYDKTKRNQSISQVMNDEDGKRKNGGMDVILDVFFVTGYFKEAEKIKKII